MSNEDDSIPVNVISENETIKEGGENNDETISLELLQNSLNEEKQK